MPNGPWPQTNLAAIIDWVENGKQPVTLNATVLYGENEGESQQLCAWPLRRLWKNKGKTMECVYDQKSIDSLALLFGWCSRACVLVAALHFLCRVRSLSYPPSGVQ
jgi:hypothetical protein